MAIVLFYHLVSTYDDSIFGENVFNALPRRESDQPSGLIVLNFATRSRTSTLCLALADDQDPYACCLGPPNCVERSVSYEKSRIFLSFSSYSTATLIFLNYFHSISLPPSSSSPHPLPHYADTTTIELLPSFSLEYTIS